MAETEVKSINGRPVADVAARAKIEEIKNAAPGLVFDTVADMEAYIAGNAGTLKVGQDLFIRESDVPDYWWDGTAAVPVETELGEVKKELAELSEAIPKVFQWANAEQFDKSALVNSTGSNSFITADGVEYYRYYAGANSFEYILPNPKVGAVTIKARAIPEKGTMGRNAAINAVFEDGTKTKIDLIMYGESLGVITVTTDGNKTLSKITGNYDFEEWVLLDMSEMSLVADYPAPESNAVGGLSDTAKTLLITILRNGVYTSDQSANITALETALGESGDVVIMYAVVNSLTNVTTNNAAESLENGNAYTATLTADDGYTLDYVKITMGGKDVTSTVYSDGVINIPAVTGNVVITAAASVSVSSDIMQIGDTLYITGGVTASLTENVLSVA